MSNIIDEKIVEMSFDNRDFEKNVHESMSTLRKLKDSFNFSNAEKSFEGLQRATEKVNFKSFSSEAEDASSSFSDFLKTVGNIWAIKKAVEALDTLESKMVSMAKSMSIDQITAGWSKYEEKTQSVQTIMAATKKPIEEVNKYLEKLNWFSDETSYSFTDMTSNVGKFTSVGVDLETATKAIMGISNWAAKSGQGVNEASRAMYNLAQALSVGSVKLMDWKSIENANMATTEFKQSAMDAAVELGKLRKQGDKYITTTKGTEVTTKNFSQTLNEAWFSSEVLLKTLGRYGGYAEQLYDFLQENGDGAMTAADAMKIFTGEVDELGKSSFLAAQEAITLTQAIDATKDAVSSGWAKTFEILFGNYEEAKESWTDLANVMWDLFAGGGEQRNSFLEAAFGQSPREMLEDTLEVAHVNSEAFYTAVGEVLKRHHWDLGDLEGEWESLAEFAKESDAWKDVDIMAEALDLISKSLDLQNNSTEQIGVNWNALKKQIEEAGGSVSDFERQASIALKESGVDVDKLIEQYGSFDNAVTEGKILSPDIIRTAFHALSKQSTDYTKTIKGGTTSLEEFENLFQDIYTKNLYGTGTKRQEELTKAGWDYEKVQALINKRARGQAITEEDLKDLHTEQVVKVENLAKNYEELGDTYGNASDSAQEMAKQILESGSDMNFLAENIDGLSGRELLFGSFLGVLENLSAVIETFRDVWSETFMSNPEGLLKTLAFVYDFVHSFELGEEELENLSDAFQGVFDIFRIFGETIGTIFGMLSPASSKLSEFVKGLINVGGAIGRIISLVSNLIIIDIKNFLFSLPEKLSAGFEKLGGLLDSVKDKFVSLFEREDGSNKLLERIDKIKAAIDIIKSKFDEVKSVFKSVFGNEQEITDPFEKSEGLVSKLHRVFELLSPVVEDVKEKLKKLFSPEISSIAQVFDKVKIKFEEVKTAIEPIYNAVKDFFTLTVPETISSTVDSIRLKFEKFKETITEVIDKVKSFFGGKETTRKKASKSDELTEKIEGYEEGKSSRGILASLGNTDQQSLTRLQKIGVVIKYFKDRVSDLISNAFPGFASWIGKISDKFSQLREIIQNSEIYKRLHEIFETKISPALSNAITFVKEKFLALKEIVQNSKIFQKIKELFETKISPALSNALTQIIAKIKLIRDSLKKNPIFEKISTFFKTNVSPFIANAFEAITDKIIKLTTNLKNFNPLEMIINFFSHTVPNFLSDSLTKIIQKIKELFSVTSGDSKPFAFIDTLKEKIGAFFRFFIENSFAIRNIFVGLFALFSGSNKFFEVIEKIKEIFSKEDSGFKLSGILQLALAIGIIAGAVALLSRIDTGKAIKGAIGVGLIMAALIVACKALAKDEKTISGSNTPLVELSRSIIQLSGAVVILSRIKAGAAVKAVLAIWVLFKILIKMMNSLAQSTQSISASQETIKSLSTTLRELAVAVQILAHMEFWKMMQGILGLGLLMGELYFLLSGISKLKGPITIAAGVITAIGGSLTLLSVVVFSIGNMPFLKALQGVGGVILLCAGLAIVFWGLSHLAAPVALGAPVILAIGAAIGLMASAVTRIANLENLQNTFLSIIELVGTFLLVGAAFAGFAYIATPALIGLGAFTLFACALTGVFALLGKITSAGGAVDSGIAFLSKLTGGLKQMFEDIASMSDSMLASVGVFTALGAAMPLFIAGITGLATMLSSLALLNKIPEIQEFLNSGADLLIYFAKVLGRVIGELIGELLSSVTGQLPDLAEGLSKFATKLLPFIAISKMLQHVDLASGMRNFLQAILVLSAADFGAKVVSLFKTSFFSNISRQIVEFGHVIHDFLLALAGLDKETEKDVSVDVEKIQNALDIIPKLQELSKMDFSGTGVLSGVFSGNLFTFSAGIWMFGKAYLQFADALVGSGLTTEDGKVVPALDSTKITDLDSAIQTMNKLADITPPSTNTNLKTFFTGSDNSLSTWGAQLAEFGPKFLVFADQLTCSGLTTKVVSVNADGVTVSSDIEIQPLDSTKISTLNDAISSIKTLSEITPPTTKSSVKAFFEGDTNLSTWGSELAEFGPKFLEFADALIQSGLAEVDSEGNETGKDIKPLNSEKIALLNDAIGSISSLAEITPPTTKSSVKAFFEGDTNLSTWGSELAEFGPKFLVFADQLINSGLTDKSGSITTEDGTTVDGNKDIKPLDSEKIKLLNEAIGSISSLADITPPATKSSLKAFFEGDTNLTSWGSELAEFGPQFLAFADTIVQSGLAEVDSEGNETGKTIKSLDSTKIKLLNEAIGSLTSLADITPPEKNHGVIAWLKGDNGLAAWGNELSGLGDGFGTFIEAITSSGLATEYTNQKNQKSLTLDDSKVKIIEQGVKFIEQLSSIEIKAGEKSWFTKFFETDNSLSTFASSMRSLGGGLRDFIGYLGGFAEDLNGNGSVISKFTINTSAIELAKKAMDVLDRIIALQIPEKAGLIDRIFEGDNSIDTFATGVEKLGNAVRTFILGVNGFEEIKGSVDSIKFSEEDIKQVLDIIPIVESLARIRIGYITTDQWGAFGWMMEQLAPSIKTFINEFTELGEDGKKLDKQAVDDVLSILPIINVLAEAANDIQGKGYEKFGDFGNALPQLVKPIKDFITELNSAFSTTEIAANKEAIEKVLDILPLISLLAKSSLDDGSLEFSASSFLQQMAIDLATFIKTVKENPLESEKIKTLTDFLTNLKTSDASVFSDFVSTFSTKYTALKLIFDTSYSDFNTIGYNIAKGIADGISNGTRDLVIPAAQKMAEAATATTTETVDSNSPSKVFEEIGGYVSEGFAIGIQNGTKGVEKSAEDLGQTAIDSTKDSVDSHSPSKEFEKIGGYIDDGLAKGIFSNIKVAETASSALGEDTANAFGVDSSGLGENLVSNVVGAITDGAGKDISGADNFADDLIDAMFDGTEEGAEDAAEKAGEGAEEATKKVVEETVVGAGEGARDGAEEVVQDEIGGVGDVVRDEFDSREGEMRASADDLVKALAEQIRANNKYFHDVSAEVFDAMVEGFKDNEKAGEVNKFFENIMHWSDSSTDRDAMLERLKDSIDQINTIINGINFTVDTSPLDSIINFISTINSVFEETEEGEAASKFDGFVEALNGLIAGINESPDVDTEKLSVIKTFADDMVKAAEGIAGVDDTTFSGFVKEIANSIKDNAKDIREAAEILIKDMLTVFGEYLDYFYQVGIDYVSKIAEGIEDGSIIATDKASTVATQILGKFREAGQTDGAKIGTDIVGAISEGLSSEGAKASIQNAIDNLFTPEDTQENQLQEGTPSMQPQEGGVETPDSQASSVGKQYANQFVGDLAAGITSSVGIINDAIDQLTENADLTVFTEEMKANLEASYQELKDPIETLAGELNSMLPDGAGMATRMIQGIIQALEDHLEEAVAAIVAFCQALTAAANAALQINSPSKVFYRIGEGIVEGTLNAVYDGMDDAEDSMYTLAERTVNGFVDGFKQASKQSQPGLKKASDAMMGTITPSKTDNFADSVKEIETVFKDLGHEESGVKKKDNPILKLTSDVLKYLEDADLNEVTITPVLDMSNVDKAAHEIGDTLNKQSYIAVGISRDIDNRGNRFDSTGNGASSGTTITYNQTINSPQALSPSKVYRNTQSLLARAGGRVSDFPGRRTSAREA